MSICCGMTEKESLSLRPKKRQEKRHGSSSVEEFFLCSVDREKKKKESKRWWYFYGSLPQLYIVRSVVLNSPHPKFVPLFVSLHTTTTSFHSFIVKCTPKNLTLRLACIHSHMCVCVCVLCVWVKSASVQSSVMWVRKTCVPPIIPIIIKLFFFSSSPSFFFCTEHHRSHVWRREAKRWMKEIRDLHH